MKDIARAHVHIAYGFKDLSDCIGPSKHAKEETKAENRNLVSTLLEKSVFAYLVHVFISCVTFLTGKQNPSNHMQPGTMYKQPLIAKIIALQWFGDKKAVGIRYPQYFNPLTVQLLAFVLTAVRIFKLHHFMLSGLCAY